MVFNTYYNINRQAGNCLESKPYTNLEAILRNYRKEISALCIFLPLFGTGIFFIINYRDFSGVYFFIEWGSDPRTFFRGSIF